LVEITHKTKPTINNKLFPNYEAIFFLCLQSLTNLYDSSQRGEKIIIQSPSNFQFKSKGEAVDPNYMEQA